MCTKWAFLVGVVALVCPLAAAPAAGATSRRVPHGFFGVTWDGSAVRAPARAREEQWALMARTGVESVRAVFSWAAAQPNAAVSPDFSRSDQIVTLAAEHGVGVLPVVVDTPAWAAAFRDPSSPPRDPADYGDFLQALEVRYGPGGSFWSQHPRLP